MSRVRESKISQHMKKMHRTMFSLHAALLPEIKNFSTSPRGSTLSLSCPQWSRLARSLPGGRVKLVKVSWPSVNMSKVCTIKSYFEFQRFCVSHSSCYAMGSLLDRLWVTFCKFRDSEDSSLR